MLQKTYLIKLLSCLAILAGSYFILEAHAISCFRFIATLCGFALLAGLTASSKT